MMRSAGIGAVKYLKEARPGELVCVQGGGHNCLGIVLEHDNERASIGLLDAGDASWRLEQYPDRIMCYSYGENWVLDCSEASRRAVSSSYAIDDHARVVIGPDGPAFIFVDQYNRFVFSTDASRLIRDLPEKLVEVDSFLIWSEEAYSTRQVAKPIFAWSKPALRA